MGITRSMCERVSRVVEPSSGVSSFPKLTRINVIRSRVMRMSLRANTKFAVLLSKKGIDYRGGEINIEYCVLK
jgi:hypothetical protein